MPAASKALMPAASLRDILLPGSFKDLMSLQLLVYWPDDISQATTWIWCQGSHIRNYWILISQGMSKFASESHPAGIRKSNHEEVGDRDVSL